MMLAWLLLLSLVTAGQDAVKLLETRCVGCHNEKNKQGGLDLGSREAALRGGGRGSAIVPGDAAGSLVYQFAAHRREPGMPLGGTKLTTAELDTLAAWLGAGAQFGRKAEATAHWAFVPVSRPRVPDGFANPVDAFLAPGRAQTGVKPVGEADRYTWLRRVSLDLTGLPPTPAQVKAFVADEIPGAHERVVDRLLASPQYGERWGRHWMDIWRYSDWYGYGAEIRNSQPNIWRWRDWIIESLNLDKGYDQMVREMLAGDEIAPNDPDVLRATGFLARNWFLFNRNVWLQDTIEATTAGFLGLTLKCARCHDHKYDPLAQEDYYRFRAFFEPHDVRMDPVPGEKAGLPRAYDAVPRPDVQNAVGTFINPAIFAETYLFTRGDERSPENSRPLTPGTPPALGPGTRETGPIALPLTAYYPEIRPEVQSDLIAAAKAQIVVAEQELETTRVRLSEAIRAPQWVRPTGRAVDFDSEVKTLLASRCGSCHLGRNRKGGFSVTSMKTIEAGGTKFGAVVVPGKSAESPLILILRGDRQPRMPLNGPALSKLEIDMLATWIDGLQPPDPAVVAREAEAQLAVGAKKVVAKKMQLTALEARIAAENATHSGDQNAERLAERARREELRASAAHAEENVLRAHQRLTEAIGAPELDDAKLGAARRALEQATTALSTPKAGYSPLGPAYPKTSTGRRTSLAEWMTSRKNPLTARVAVNHIWLRHFGTALVSSVTDFGRNGKQPTHPALLDWLAAELMESGWSMKHIHRLLVTSEAYRMGSAVADPKHPNLSKDPENRFYWRMPARRLEAEAIRDSVLAVAGALDLKMGGPELNEETQTDLPRRSLYFRVTPDAQLTFLKIFDGVDPTACFARSESIVPQQALALANSKLSLTQSRAVADQLAASGDFIGDAFLRVLGRPPTLAEIALSKEFLGTGPERRANLVHALFNRNEFVTLR